MAPPVVSKYLISETHGSVTLQVGCILAAPDGSLNKTLKKEKIDGNRTHFADKVRSKSGMKSFLYCGLLLAGVLLPAKPHKLI